MCHDRKLRILRHYCMNENIINAFWTLKNATTIAVNTSYDNVYGDGRAPLLRASLSTVVLAVTPLLGEKLHESRIEGRRV
jgi:hypothetical protein